MVEESQSIKQMLEAVRAKLSDKSNAKKEIAQIVPKFDSGVKEEPEAIAEAEGSSIVDEAIQIDTMPGGEKRMEAELSKIKEKIGKKRREPPPQMVVETDKERAKPDKRRQRK